MAGKQTKLQQRSKHPRAASKLHCPPSQERSSDPWSFLELIDAPQWVDLSLEASLMGQEGFDSWFDRSHKHHVMSLAGLNTNMFWLRLGKSSQSKGPMLSKGCQKEVNKPEKKRTAVHLNKLGNGQSQSQSRVTGLRVHKGAQYSNIIERACNAHKQSGSVETGCSLSGHSGTSECEPSGSFKKHSLCSDRSSVSSSLQACSVELKLSSNVKRGSSNVNQAEDFHDTPTSCSGGARRNRNSSSASYCPMVKSRYFSEVGVSICKKSSEHFVSCVTKSQFVCEADRQSSGDSVVTSVSGASRTSEEQVGKGCARAMEEGTDCVRKLSEQEDGVDCNQLLMRDFIADSSTLNKNLLLHQQNAKEVVQSSIKAGTKQLYTGKENVPPNENSTAANFRQVKDKPFQSKAPFALASSKTANARAVSLTMGGGFHVSQVSKKKISRCASEVDPRKTGASQNQNNGHASSIARQWKRSELKPLTVASEKASKSKGDLAALVAQHNQRIRSLGVLENFRKGLR